MPECDIRIFSSEDELARAAEKIWQEAAAQALRERNLFVVALSGGCSPVGLYRRLVLSKNLPWERTHLFLADERFVPLEDKDSNYRLINELLLEPAGIDPSNCHPVPVAENSAEAAARRYEEELSDFFSKEGYGSPVFDLVVLGMGRDGHTASLFPGNPDLFTTERLTVSVNGGQTRHQRVSLGLSVINSSKNVVFLVSGRGKAAIVRRVLERGDSDLPASRVKPVAGQLFFLLDEDASKQIKPERGIE
ncbi:MAG: 6-phosphogluconolactonase [Candidatus Omnitrophica bacterium]|nr:6-phosphogluconolactonase [Candidatus Omnitrophota bacterium]